MNNIDLNENLACSDGGCIFGHPGGMHTNGGCKCLIRPTMTRDELYIIKTKIRKLVAQKKKYKEMYEQEKKRYKSSSPYTSEACSLCGYLTCSGNCFK